MSHPKSFVVVSTPPRNKRTLALLAAPLLVALAAASAQAQSVWSANASGDASGSWATATNWNPASVPNGNSVIADFSQQDITAASTVTLDGAQTVSALIFGDTDPSTAATWTVAAGTSGTLALAAASGAPSITVNTSTATISAPIAGTQGFTKLGSGTLALTGANTFTGGVTATAGTITLSGVTNSSTVLGTNAVTFNGGSVLFNTQSSTFAQGVVVNSGTSSTLTFNKGSNYFSPTSLTGSGQLSLNQGTGSTNTITLSGDYTNFTGTLVLTNKYFRFSSTSGAYNTAGGANAAWVLGDGAQLSYQAGTNLTMTYSLGSLSSSVSTSILSGGSSSGGGTVVYQIGNLNQDSTYAGTIVDGSTKTGLTKVGTGTLTVSGSASYTGATNVNAGTLKVTGTYSGSTAISVNSGGTLTAASGSTIGGGTLLVANGGRVNLLGTVNDATEIQRGGQLVYSGTAGSLGGGLTLDAGGILAQSDPTAGLHLSSLTWNGGGQINLALGTTFNSLLVDFLGSGSGLLDFNFSDGGGLLAGQTYTLLTTGGTYLTDTSSLTYSSNLSGFSGQFLFDGSTLQFQVLTVPEPRPGLLLVLGLAAFGLRRSRLASAS